MVGLAHVILHVGLCSAVARTPYETTVAMRAKLSYPNGEAQFEKVYRFQRGEGQDAVVEFDIGRGAYRLQLDVPKYNCGAIDFLNFLPDHNRVISETLSDGVPQIRPIAMLQGTTPISFQYARPTFVLFDQTLACNQPVGTPLPANVVVENERDAYYVWLYLDPALAARKPVVAFRLRTPTGLEHFVRIRMPYLFSWSGFPSSTQLNLSEDMIDGLATEKSDTLLCPPVWESRVSSGAIPRALPLPRTVPLPSPSAAASPMPSPSPSPQTTP